MSDLSDAESRLLRDLGTLKTEVLRVTTENRERIVALESKVNAVNKIKIGSVEVSQQFITTMFLIAALIFLTLDKSQQDKLFKIGEGAVTVDKVIVDEIKEGN